MSAALKATPTSSKSVLLSYWLMLYCPFLSVIYFTVGFYRIDGRPRDDPCWGRGEFLARCGGVSTIGDAITLLLVEATDNAATHRLKKSSILKRE